MTRSDKQGTESTPREKTFQAAIVIGRFQPLHRAHLSLIQKALSLGEKCLIVLGSHRGPTTIRNPWTSEQRQEMILEAIPLEERRRIVFLGVRDYLYNDDLWAVTVQQAVSNALDQEESGRVALVGCKKDRSSYYLGLFPQWDLSHIHIPQEESILMNATEIREDFFSGGLLFQARCPPNISYYLMKYRAENPEFQRLKGELEYVRAYKAAWEKAPYQPTFVTADAVVIYKGHVLVVRRKSQPGAGSIALPGGFIRGDEQVRDAAIRELKEETEIAIPKRVLYNSIKAQGVFDHPERSLRGRTITHAFLLKLPRDPAAPLPKVKGGDDAEKAWWMPISEVIEKEPLFFEDHVQIINHFLSRS